MDKQLASLKRRAAKARAKSTRGRYPPDLREELTEFAATWISSGRTRRELSRRTGVDDSTLAYWLQRRPVQPTGFREVELAAEAPVSELVMRLRSGAVVEGLTVESLAALLARLE